MTAKTTNERQETFIKNMESQGKKPAKYWLTKKQRPKVDEFVKGLKSE